MTARAEGEEASEERGGGARRILLNSGYRAFADVGGRVASLALYVVMARIVGDAQFGVYSFALSFVGLVTILGTLGQDFVLTREVARDRTRVHEYFANTIALRVATTLPLLALAALVGAQTGFDAQTLALVAILGVGYVAELLSSVCYAVFQAFERLQYVPAVLITQRWLTAVGGILALALGAGIEVVAVVYLVVAVIAFALAVSLISWRVVRPRLVIDPGRWWPLMRAALVIGVVAIFAVMLMRIDIAILAGFEPDAVVGQYAAAFRLFESTVFVSWSVAAAVLPVFSRLRPDSEPPLALVFERALKLVLALTLPLAVVAVAVPETLVVAVFGEEFRPAASALALLAPTIVAYGFAFLAGDLLIAQYRQVAVAVTYGVGVLVNVGLNFLLIPALSLDGAAIATSVAQVVVAVPMLVIAARLTGRLDWRRMLAGATIGSLVAGGAMAALSPVPLVALAAGAAAYLLVIVTFERFAYPEDVAAVRSMLRRGSAQPTG